MKPQTLKYLQKDQVGKVIATGLAMLYMNKPQKPIKYLAEWLKQYSHNQRQMAKLIKSQKQKGTAVKNYQKQKQVQKTSEKQVQNKIAKQKQKYDQIKDLITNHQYHYDLLEEILPQFIENKIKATGVYIGQLTHPSKAVTQQDTDQNSHLDTTAQKLIHYIGSSKSHKNIIRGKTLKTTQGVTAGGFALLDQVQAPVLGQDGQQIPQPPKPKYVYIPNVAKNQSMYFFRIPKLGSYISIPIGCNEYLLESNFDVSLKQKQQYLKQCEQLQKAKKEELEQLQRQKQQLQKKIAELTEKNSQANLIQQARKQLSQVQTAITQKQKENIEQKHPQLTGNKKLFCLCADTLGQDRQFSPTQIQFLAEISNYFRDAWQNKQKQILKNDIINHIEGIKNLQQTPENYKSVLDTAIQLTQQQHKQIAAITQQQKKTFRQLQLQIIKFKTVIETNPFYVESFLRLKKLRVAKYKQLIQNILYFLGYKKSDINIPNRASINWRQVKQKYITQDNFLKIFQYNPIGPKQGQYPNYCKVPQIADAVDKFSEEQVFNYNIALGAIVIFLKKVLLLRQTDVQIRKAKYQIAKSNREKLLQQNEKVNAKLAEDLQKHKSTLSQEDAANFNQASQASWKEQYYTKHPLHEIPPQIVQEKDNDM